MMPSVLLVTNEYPPERIAGTAMSTLFLAEELAARGSDVSVVVNTRQTAPPRETAHNPQVFRLKPVGLPTTRMAQRAALLLNIARQMRPDIIQGQSVSCGSLALIVGRCLHIPTITYVQGYDLYESGAWARRTYIRWTLIHSDRVAAVTDDLRSKAWDLSGRLVEVIPHGLRIREAHGLDRQAARTLLSLPRHENTILFVGRLIRLKGVSYLIRAMPRVLASHPDTRLVLIGDGDERPNLLELVRRLKLETRIVFGGERTHEEVIRFMRASDVLVLPSLAEPFGIVLLEGMSCGLPVVASNVMGIPSLVEDGTNGFLVPPGDEASLAERICELFADPAKRAEIGLRNQRKAISYSWPHIVDQFLRLWDAAMASRRNGARPAS